MLLTDCTATPSPTVFTAYRVQSARSAKRQGWVAPKAIGEGLGVPRGSSERQIPAR
jgi:hypothetical protein